MIIHSKVFVWNCRGAANTSFLRYCKQYVDVHRPIMLIIVETRCDPKKLCCTFKLLGYDEMLTTENRGYTGGIVVAWKKENINVTLTSKKFQFMHLKVQFPNGRDWYFTPVYASPNEENRRVLWEDLKNIAARMEDSRLLAGDFNDIMFSTEKKGGAPVSVRKCNNFRERINACQLMDIGSMGAKFTWRGPNYHGGQRIYERLDRALSNDKWRIQFPDGYVRVLPRVIEKANGNRGVKISDQVAHMLQ
ncbi:hypothetical protein TSUD_145750 [Trifolium subterraneum]|uniref:Endonuclease/exonuclease/phosphatase domain-containing protein n=1 Tax=Trifolium subterraneum TaxID=3900 RepID=A0A2Z6MMJ7_TRISU|nr:hypothetical protein TSUD_145750 [Trifolium subterraneum]